MSLNNEEIIDDEEKVESDSAVNDDHETDDIPNDSQPVKDEVVMGSGAAIIKKTRPCYACDQLYLTGIICWQITMQQLQREQQATPHALPS